MNRVIFFAFIALPMLTFLHYWLWRKLVRDTAPPTWLRRLGGVLLVLLALSIPIGIAIMRMIPRESAALVSVPALFWMGFAFLVLISLTLIDLVLLAKRFIQRQKPEEIDPERRSFLARVSGGVALTSSAAISGVGVSTAYGELDIERREIVLQKLPTKYNNLRIVQVSDIHIGPALDKSFASKIVETVNALQPDIIAITGDLVDGTVEELRDHVAPFAKLSAKLGTFFVTGNHDYYSGVEPWVAEVRRLGITVLRNESIVLGEGNDTFTIAGVEDYMSFATPESHRAALQQAVSKRATKGPLLLLAHQPRVANEAAELGVDLQLSGHTHGGQIFPFGFFAWLQQGFLTGHYRVKDLQLYVNRGTGFWGPPMRVGIPPEVTLLTLRCVASQ